MLRLTEIRLPLDHPAEALTAAILARLGLAPAQLVGHTVFRRGYDARKASAIQLVYTLDVELAAQLDETALLARLQAQGQTRVTRTPDMRYRFVTQAPPGMVERPLVVGLGPCGLFAGLVLAQMGFRPIILERGKDVRARTRDTWGLWRKQTLDPESNVQFGEGGAGTFSDGKLYSQVKDPQHHGRKVLEEFVRAGAPPEILYLSKPHIGTFRLVRMIQHMRAEIIRLGGEVRFQHKVVDLLLSDEQQIDKGGVRQVRGVRLADGRELAARHVVLALGHSARDTFAMLQTRGVAMEAKPFSIGVRIEHPQSLIDRARFGRFAGHPLLGAADYKLVHHASTGRSAYSFCMCPGGTVVAATSEAGQVVTNGMSQYSRNERNANSALVVDVTPADFFADARIQPLAGVDFQRHWERLAYELGGGNYAAPVQRLADFMAGRPSTRLGTVQPSYTPAVRPTDLRACLPDYVVATLREALPAFARQIRGYDLADAVLTGVETRTSSPLRLPRGADMQSLNTRGLYPAGEGAGYAGGILSAAIDGLKVAEALALQLAGQLPPEAAARASSEHLA